MKMQPENLVSHILSPENSQLQFQPQFLEAFNTSNQKVAILASNEFEGFSKNGGIGTYYTTLSQKLAAEGWYVILLLCHSHENFQGNSQQQNLQHIFSTGEVEKVLNLQPIHQAILSKCQKDSISQCFDSESFCCLFFTQAIVATFPEAVVYVEFPAIWGLGYRTIQAKKSGVLGNSCLVGVTDHGGFEWLRETNSRYTVDYPKWFWRAYHYEQYSYDNADLTCFPSYFLKSKVENYGWKTSRAVHLPYFIPILNLSADVGAKHSGGSASAVTELVEGQSSRDNLPLKTNVLCPNPSPSEGLKTSDILTAQVDKKQIPLVFFGRLEERKGLCTFVEALKQLSPDIAEKIDILFLGKIIKLESTELQGLDSQQYIDDALKGKFYYHILPDLSSIEAIGLVSQLPTPIVCLCSSQENFPNTALEMGQLAVSLVVSDTGGFQETLSLISRTDGVRWFEPGDVHSLVSTISEAISACPETPIAPERTFLSQVNQKLLNQRLEYMSEAFIKSAPKEPQNPCVTIGITCFFDTIKILDCLESLAGQTYQNLEVIVLYETLADESILDVISLAKEQFPTYQFVESDVNKSLGAAYNRLVELTTGEYFLQFAGDRIALPMMVEKFVTAACESDAVAVVCPDMTLDKDLEVINSNDGSLLKLLEFNQSRDLCALFAVELLREFRYSEVRDLLALNWHILAAAIAIGKEIAYYPYPLYLSDSHSAFVIDPAKIPKERYYLRQYLSQIEASRWTQRQLNLLLTCVEQLWQSETQKQSQMWQLEQDKNRYQALASQSQAWMQTALETQDELDSLQSQLQQAQAEIERLKAEQQQVQKPIGTR
ncbi:glycosyltransferase [Microcoleus sp. CAWBG51]|uniref:glycosyltransferase n=2 Tax=unclassified Microcoleus TaxID=2642155 RepID=UPI0025EFD6C2|nr:glycosyltransferase [Microcoleus sp. CAWBG51]